MRVAITVPITVQIEFDMTEEEAAAFQSGEDPGLEKLTRTTQGAIQDAIHQNAGMGLADDMVDLITEETGWCIRSLSMQTE